MSKDAEAQLVKEMLKIKKERIEVSETTVVFDGKQYSIRIPKKMAEAVEIEPSADKFRFRLVFPRPDSDKEPRITAELIRGKDVKEKETAIQ